MIFLELRISIRYVVVFIANKYTLTGFIIEFFSTNVEYAFEPKMPRCDKFGLILKSCSNGVVLLLPR
jgi:hypothetical protein